MEYEGKRHQQQLSSKSSRSPSPESVGPASPSSGESFRPILRTPPPSRVGPPPSPPVPTHPIAPVTPEPSAPLPLSPCPVCGRTFVPASLAKHVKICEKMTVKKRKTFDSSRQRREGLDVKNHVIGTDLEQYLPKNFGLPENSPFLEKSPPNTAKATPKPKTVSVRSAIMKPTADLQKCPHCNRAFGVRAFERHVEWCADKAKILPAAPAQPPPHIADAKQRLNARTQYKAPPVRTRRSSQSRDKSSNSRSASVESSRGISPPREFGDYRHQRTRASESASSNDCHEDSSPHIPIIRNSRASQNNSSGDANVKARQARLARDISSSRSSQEPHITSAQESNTVPKLVKDEPCKPKNRLNVKKRQQLKKLEEITNKYNERKQTTKNVALKNSAELESVTKNIKKVEKIEIPVKSQIPVPKKIKQNKRQLKQDKNSPNTDNNMQDDEMKNNFPLKDLDPNKDVLKVNIKEKKVKTKNTKEVKKRTKESTISLDSLEGCSSDMANKDKNCQSIGINTELLCPCIPCVIHDVPDLKFVNSKRTTSNKKKIDKNNQSALSIPQPVVELLYKNPNMTNSCDNENKHFIEEQLDSNENIRIQDYEQSVTALSNCLSTTKEPVSKDSFEMYIEISKDTNDCDHESTRDSLHDDVPNLSEENIELNNEHDMSAESFEDSFETNDNSNNKANDNDEDGCRHGSGETYTKFTEDPSDFDEFLNITDKLISNSEMEKCVENIHTPQTDSLESIDKNVENDTKTSTTQHTFSNSLEELKNDLKDLLYEAEKDVNVTTVVEKHENKEENIETQKNVNNMEHITVYGLQFVDQEKIVPNLNLRENPSELKLPSINDTNKCSIKTNSIKKISSLYKGNKKCKMLGQQKRSNNENRTFIINENQDEVSDEAPPLKLPRIDDKSNNNIMSDKIFPSSIKRSTSLLDSIQKKSGPKIDNTKSRHKTDQLEEDLMQSLKDFDKFYESERNENQSTMKETAHANKNAHDSSKKDFKRKTDHKSKKSDSTNGNYTPNGKSSNDSAYSRLVSLNRISPSKLSLCNTKENNGISSLEKIPADVRSISSEEFLAMERSTELDETLLRPEQKEVAITNNDKRSCSRQSRHSSGWGRRPEALSSSGSESSLHKPAPRLSRFCHECGSRFLDTAKFCIECGVKRLLI
nr:TNF receptor-associated factor family protein DDB_G0272098 isoform X2 [Danaus plexippus plexippus]